MPGSVRMAHAQMGLNAPKIPQMGGRLRSRMTVLGIVAILVALSVGIVPDGRPVVSPSATHELSSQNAPDRMVNGFPGSVDVASITIPDAARVPRPVSASFAIWAVPMCLAALLALLVFRRRRDQAAGPARQLRWRGATGLRAPPRLQFA